ncbi:MAG TPA: hypothetical protein VEX60_17810 [Pyrinomonadaceae bacterium]|jgi:heme exporter protein D|nr:hypothetical protein [Pyrinomonadaceae bacterium]
MRFIVFVWVAVELLQIAVIAMLVVGYRNLERRLKQVGDFESRPPRSVTEE